MYGWYVCPLNARAENFFLKKTRLTSIYSETTALSKPYFIFKLQSVRKFRRNCLLFKKQKVDSTGYYGIEDPFPDLISKLRRFRGDAECRLLIGQEPLVVRVLMLRKLLLLEGSCGKYVIPYLLAKYAK